MTTKNFNDGTIISNASLESEKEIAESFSILLASNRFDWFEYLNETVRWTAKLALFTGQFEGNWHQPAGYSVSTGVTVGGTNIFPNQHSHVVLQPQVLCQATRVKCSAQLTNNDTGQEVQFNHTDQVAPAGQYFVGVRFGITQNSAAGSRAPKVTMELIDSENVRHLVLLREHK
jgi:hypothetical protein